MKGLFVEVIRATPKNTMIRVGSARAANDIALLAPIVV
ncbi:hypothetical protein BMS3Bbin15_01044 [archaeon BMS3Bbin15]|nr:hypothetical protein BMS3Bbin15_01044 [archaeon BMS3Bbin15]